MGYTSSGGDAVDNLPERILAELATHDDGISSLQLAQMLNLDHQRIIGAIKSLEAQSLKVLVYYTFEFVSLLSFHCS